jgi:hypothetical protein
MNSQATLIASAGWTAGTSGTASGRLQSIKAARAMNARSTASVMDGGSAVRNEWESSW